YDRCIPSVHASATAEIYTLSLHDALPILHADVQHVRLGRRDRHDAVPGHRAVDLEHDAVIAGEQAVAEDTEAPREFVRGPLDLRSEEHTSELQSRENLVCRLLLEKKNKTT